MNDNKNNNQRKLSRGMSFLYGMKPKKQEEQNSDLSHEPGSTNGTVSSDASTYNDLEGGYDLRPRKSVLQDDFAEQNTYEDAAEEDFNTSNQTTDNNDDGYEAITQEDEDDEEDDEGDEEEEGDEGDEEANEEDDFIEAEELNEEESEEESEEGDEDDNEDDDTEEEDYQDDEDGEEEEEAQEEDESFDDVIAAGSQNETDEEDGETEEEVEEEEDEEDEEDEDSEDIEDEEDNDEEYEDDDLNDEEQEDTEDYTALEDEDEDDEDEEQGDDASENDQSLDAGKSLSELQGLSVKQFSAASSDNKGQKMSLSQRLAAGQVVADDFDVKGGKMANADTSLNPLTAKPNFNQEPIIQDGVSDANQDTTEDLAEDPAEDFDDESIENDSGQEHEETVLDGDFDIGGVASEEPEEDEEDEEDENEAESGDVGFDDNGLALVPIELIHPNPDQPRKDFNDTELAELAHSIAEKGILQPIILLEVIDAQKHKTYQIIAGERRYRASQLAGIKAMPAIIKTHLSENELFEISIIENLQRSALNPVEEASAYYNLTAKYDYTQEQVAHAVGKTRSYIANMLRLLNLPHTVKLYLKSGELSTGHGKVLAGLPNAAMLADVAVKKQLSVRELEKLIKTTRLQEMQDHIGGLKSANEIRPDVKTNLQNYVSKLKQHGVDAVFKFNPKSGSYDFTIKTKEVHLLLEMLSLLDVEGN